MTVCIVVRVSILKTNIKQAEKDARIKAAEEARITYFIMHTNSCVFCRVQCLLSDMHFLDGVITPFRVCDDFESNLHCSHVRHLYVRFGFHYCIQFL